MTTERPDQFVVPFPGELEMTFFSTGGKFFDRSQRRERLYRLFQVGFGHVWIARARAYDDGEWVFWASGQSGSVPVFSTRGEPEEFVVFIEAAGRRREG